MSMRNCVPFTSLPVRVIAMTDEEFTSVRDSLKGAGLKNPVSRFEAIRGTAMRDEMIRDETAISPRALYEIEKAETREAHSSRPSWGGVGCYLSHAALWREAAASDAGMILAEADCRAKPDAAEESARVFADVCALLERPPELLWLGYLSALRQTPSGLNGISQVGGIVHGTHFYYVSPAGARTLLSRSRPIEVQVDSYMGYMTSLNSDKFASFAPQRTLFTQQNATGTSIQSKRVEDVMATGPDTTLLKLMGALIFILSFLCVYLLLVAIRPSAIISSHR